MLEIKVNDAFEFLYTEERKKYREIIIRGGRGSSKTYGIKQFFTLQAITNKSKFFVFRETKDMIKEAREDFSDYLEDSNIKFTLGEMFENVTNNNGEPLIIKNEVIEFFNGSKIIFSFVNDSVVKKRKSLREVNGAWIDEAHYITEYTHRNLLPSIRGFEDSFLIYTFNPQKSDDFLYQRSLNYKSDRLKVLSINYDKNPFFPELLNNDRLDDFKNLPRKVYNHIWLGEPLDFNDLQVIDTTKIGRFDDNVNHKYKILAISADTAFSKSESADYSCLGLFGRTEDDKIHLIRMVRSKFDFHELLTQLKSLYIWACENYQNVNYIFIEDKASGQSLIQEVQRLTSLNVKGINPIKDKFTRLIDCIDDFYKLQLPLSNDTLNFWVKDFIKECENFRGDLKHEHDDQVDCVTQFLNATKKVGLDWGKLANML